VVQGHKGLTPLYKGKDRTNQNKKRKCGALRKVQKKVTTNLPSKGRNGKSRSQWAIKFAAGRGTKERGELAKSRSEKYDRPGRKTRG